MDCLGKNVLKISFFFLHINLEVSKVKSFCLSIKTVVYEMFHYQRYMNLDNLFHVGEYKVLRVVSAITVFTVVDGGHVKEVRVR